MGARRHPWRRGQVAVFVSLVVVVGLTALAVSKLDLSALALALDRVQLDWLVAAVLLMSGAFLARSESWYRVIRGAVPESVVTRSEVRRGLLIGMAGSSVAPGRLGEAARTWVVARHIGELSSSVAVVAGTVLAQTLLNMVALLLLTIGAIIGWPAMSIRVAGIFAVVLLPVGIVVTLKGGPALLARLTRGRDGRRARLAKWIATQIRLVGTGVAALRRPATAVRGGAWQLSAWGLQLLTCYVVLQGVGGAPHAPLSASAAVLVAVNITAIFPLTPSNIGVFQAACVAALVPFGVHPGEAVACGLILQGVEIVCSLALGIPALLREGISWGELRHAHLYSSGAAQPGRP
jgi:phosphatidylinositol alpha-mannosyltransferase